MVKNNSIFNHFFNLYTMQNNLKVALLQVAIVWQNIEENTANYTNKILAIIEPVDLIVLPEMFSTGFSMKPAPISEKMNGNTVKWMKKMAVLKNCAIAGSLIIEDDLKYYNRFLFVHPTGKVDYYDKRHLFTLAGEEKVFSKGIEKITVNYKGWKICPMVCYDLRFPVWSRNVEDYDMLIYVANWPKSRITAWDILLKARAVENMSYVVGLNRVGQDNNGLIYTGHSAIYNGLGSPILTTQATLEECVIIDLEKQHVIDIRKKFNFLNDADDFVITTIET